MKILCFFPIFRSVKAKATFLGAERQFAEICKRWVKLGNEVHIVGTNYAKKLCEKFGLKVEAYTSEPTVLKLVGLEDYVNIRKMCKTIPNGRFDFIYCPSEPFEYVFPSVIAKKQLKTRVVGSVNLFHPDDVSMWSSFKNALAYAGYRGGIAHLKSIPRRLLFAFKKNTRTLLLKKMDLIFTVSEYIKNLLVKVGIDEERIYPVSSGIDYNYIRSIPSPQDKKFDACFLGAIIPRKGVLDLVRAWAKVVKVKPSAKLAIVGEGSGLYLAKVKEFIAKHNLRNNVVMTGFVPEERKYKLLKQSKIFVFPSYLESFAQVICEAMACGLPVVAYQLPVYKEFYGNNIAYVRSGDIDALATTIIHLFDNENLQREMRGKGYKIAKQYDWNRIANYELKVITQHLKIR